MKPSLALASFCLLFSTVAAADRAGTIRAGEEVPRATVRAAADDQAQLWITDSFQSPARLEKTVALRGQSVMAILGEHTALETAYGGGFVTRINGVPSELSVQNQANWFYYVNGILAHVGAAQYVPKDGDVVWWDDHAWSDDNYLGSIIGAYPQPFLGG